MSDLHLPLKGVYFDQIKHGEKTQEFREVNEYWSKRLIGRKYDSVILTRGYPKKGDPDRTLKLPYRGFKKIWINHPHFGDVDTEVFAINVSQPKAEKG